MTIFRFQGRLVKAFRVSPAKVAGSWIEIEDYFTGAKRKINDLAQLEIVAVR